MYEPLGKCGSRSSGWQSFFSIDGRLMRAMSAAEAMGDAISKLASDGAG